MVGSTRFSSFLATFLMVVVALPTVAQDDRAGRIKKNQTSVTVSGALNQKITQVKQFIRKHQTAISYIGAVGALAVAWYFVPQKKQKQRQQQPIQPVHVAQRLAGREGDYVVGASPCEVNELVLHPGVYQGNWHHRLVDGTNGYYAYRHANGEQVFAVRNTYNVPIEQFVDQEGRYRFNAQEFVRMQEVRNPIVLRFRLDRDVPMRQLFVIQQVGNTCAYHALKNCRLIVHELLNHNGNLQQQLESEHLVQQLIGDERGNLGLWPAYILRNHPHWCAMQEGDRAGEWLHPQGVQALIDNEEEHNAITMIEAGRFQELQAQSPFEAPRPYDLSAHPEDALIHGFVVQNRDHWLAAVLRRMHGRIEWFIADSNNQPAFHRAGIMHLIASLHGRIA